MARSRIKAATDDRPFVMIYHDMLESPLLDNHYQKLVYIYLKKFANSKGQCYPSVKTLSKQTKISPNKIRLTLFELEDLGLLRVENRYRDDGGKSSNQYTLLDYKEVWTAKTLEEAEEAINKHTDKQTLTEYDDQALLAEMERRGYTVVKEKEPELHPTKDATQTPKQDQFCILNNNKNSEKSQEGSSRYSLEQIKKDFDFEVAIAANPDIAEEYEIVMSVLHKIRNSTRAYNIKGQIVPADEVWENVNALTMEEIFYAIENYKNTKSNIKDYDAYWTSVLYNAKENYKRYINNLWNQNN